MQGEGKDKLCLVQSIALILLGVCGLCIRLCVEVYVEGRRSVYADLENCCQLSCRALHVCGLFGLCVSMNSSTTLPFRSVTMPPITFLQLEEELKATASRAETMNGVVDALPTKGDTERMRAYNWQDVQDLQDVGFEFALVFRLV